jgi:CheY-like chemotaxis protein
MVPGIKIKIFLADDTASRMAACRHQLLSTGYTAVFSFANADACIKRLRLMPDLVVLPYPVKSPEAIDRLKQIRAFSRQIRVVFMGESPESTIKAAIRKTERRKLAARRWQAVEDKILGFIRPARQAG